MIRLGSIIPGSRNFSPIGLEMGATSIKMAQLQRTANGWEVRDMLAKEIPSANNENGRSRKEELIQIIKDGLKESTFSGRSVVSVMPGYQLDIFPIKLALSGDEGLEEAILEEARAHLSYNLENAVIDYIPVENSESDPEKGKTARFLLISARREDVDELLSVLKGAKLKPAALDISACALARIIGFSLNTKDKNALVVNAGELHTTLSVLWKGNILFDRHILWGQENMVESIMNRLKLDRQKTTRLLSRVGLHSGHSGEARQENDKNHHINKITEAVYEIVATQLEKLAKEIDKVLQYFSSEMRGAAIDVLYIIGAAGIIKYLDVYLGERTDIATQYFNPLRILRAGNSKVLKDDNGQGLLFSVPLGLAMRGLKKQDFRSGRE